jgi:Flp pilus assembly pilin Flp
MAAEAHMAKALYHFWVHEDGQDLVEYTLLIALAALAGVSLVQAQGVGIKPVWGSASTLVGNAAMVATS